MSQHHVQPRAVSRRRMFYAAVCTLVVTLVIAGAGCSAFRERKQVIGPFTRAVMLFYELDKLPVYADSVLAADALNWLALERGKPKMISVVAFNDKDVVVHLERRPTLWTWTSSDNVAVQPTTDGPTARVTITEGNTGWVQVASAGFIGNIKVLRQGYRK